MPPVEIRKEARASLKGKWGKAVCITLVFLAFSMLIGFVQGVAGEGTFLYNIIELAFLVIEVPLSFGLLVSLMKFKRNEEVSAFSLFKEGFSRFGKSWGIALHTLLRMLLPIACFIILVILFFTMQFFFIASSINGNTISSSTGTVLSLIFIVLEIASIIYIVSRSLLYTLGYYISYDNPELSSKECVKKSEELMKGNRGNYFMLGLSFIGWILLLLLATSVGTAVLSFLFVLSMGIVGSYIGVLAGYLIMIIGMLFLMPYMQVATICFYERIIKNKETEKAEE